MALQRAARSLVDGGEQQLLLAHGTSGGGCVWCVDLRILMARESACISVGQGRSHPGHTYLHTYIHTYIG